jgi:TolB protein
MGDPMKPVKRTSPFARIFWLALRLVLFHTILFMAAFLVGRDISARTVAFIWDMPVRNQVHLLEVDRGLYHKLNNIAAQRCCLSWSPDGEQIAFTSQSGNTYKIFLMDQYGGQVRRLTDTGDLVDEYLPAWSADGQQLLFVLNENYGAMEAFDLYIMRRDGTRLARLGDASYGYFSPTFSPDGSRIAYHSMERPDAHNIFVMNTDGSSPTQLTDGGYEIRPRWSPDGRKILYQSLRLNGYELWVMNADGSGKKRLTDNHVDDTFPTWSADGRQIIFTSTRNGRTQLYVMNADGGGEYQLTNYSLNVGYAEWQPRSPAAAR